MKNAEILRNSGKNEFSYLYNSYMEKYNLMKVTILVIPSIAIC